MTFSQLSALVVEGNPLARSVLVRMLLELGFKTVAQSARPRDALRKLEGQSYDYILCEYHFDEAAQTGKAFVEDLRNSRQLPLSTAFLMVTTEASQTKVSEAAESALDNYLLKPFNFNGLRIRLAEVQHRKNAFKEVYAAIVLEDYKEATRLCSEMVKAESRYWVNAARLAAELHLSVAEYAEAEALYEKVSGACAVPWARLGIAKVALEAGHSQKAVRTLESLISENPTYADAYDILGRGQLIQGQFDQAYATFEKAVKLTPGSLSRLQKLGALAYLKGEPDHALEVLDKAFRLGAGSRMYDYQSLVLLSFLKFDKKDPKFLVSAASILRQQLDKYPQSFRLSCMIDLVAILYALQTKQLQQAISGLESLAARIREPEFDFELAGNFLSALHRVTALEVRVEKETTWVQALGARFCATKLAVDLLGRHAPPSCVHRDILEVSLVHAQRVTQAALTKGISGDCQGAVVDLVTHGEQSLNAKVLEVASLVLDKYKNRLSTYDEIVSQVEMLRMTYCSYGTQIGLAGLQHKKRAAVAGLRTLPASTEEKAISR